jgi:hypothetical protein
MLNLISMICNLERSFIDKIPQTAIYKNIEYSIKKNGPLLSHKYIDINNPHKIKSFINQ